MELCRYYISYRAYISTLTYFSPHILSDKTDRCVKTCRDKKLRLFDPRAGSDAVRVTDGHAGVKGSRVVWLGDRDRIATTGVSCIAIKWGLRLTYYYSLVGCPTDRFLYGTRPA